MVNRYQGRTKNILGKQIHSFDVYGDGINIGFADFFHCPEDNSVVGYTKSDGNETLYRWGFNVLEPVYGKFSEGQEQCHVAIGYETVEPNTQWNSRDAPTTELFELFRTVQLTNLRLLKEKATSKLIERICGRFDSEEGKKFGIVVDVLRRSLTDKLLNSM